MSKELLDATDRKILKFLVKNARMPYLEIARACGISGAAIHQRIKKLEEELAKKRQQQANDHDHDHQGGQSGGFGFGGMGSAMGGSGLKQMGNMGQMAR